MCIRDRFTRIKNKPLNSGYSNKELELPMQKALSISRDQILNVNLDTLNISQCETPAENNINNKVMSFVTQFNSHTSIFRNFFNDNSNELNSIIGEHQIIMANRKNPNLGDVLFSGKKLPNHLYNQDLMPLVVLDV